jgi:hypothetical protein
MKTQKIVARCISISHRRQTPSVPIAELARRFERRAAGAASRAIRCKLAATGQRRRPREREAWWRTSERMAPACPGRRDVLRRAIHALGDYEHVSVRAGRGHLTICGDDGAPVARATPLGAGQFGLSYHTHTGLWEPMPVVADLAATGSRSRRTPWSLSGVTVALGASALLVASACSWSSFAAPSCDIASSTIAYRR